MSEQAVFAMMEACAAAGLHGGADAVTQLASGLRHANWRVRYAAAIAAGDLGEQALIPDLLAVLAAEDQVPLWAEPRMVRVSDSASAIVGDTLAFAEGSTPEEIAAWERRGRLKQAAMLALGQIGVAAPGVLDRLHRELADREADYTIRAAAGKALQSIVDPASRPILEEMARDDEFCTRVEARKALAKLPPA